MIRMWMRMCQRAYNLTIDLINQKIYSIKTLRARVFAALGARQLRRGDVISPRHIPYDIIGDAVREAKTIFSTCMKRGTKFVLGERHAPAGFSVQRSKISCSGDLYPSYLGRLTQSPFTAITHDTRVIEEHGKFYITRAYKIEPWQSQVTGYASIDVGVRSMLAVYTGSEFFEIDIGTKIDKRQATIDAINARLRLPTTKQKKTSLVRARRKHYNRITSRVTDLHCQSAKMLCSSFKDIFISAVRIKALAGKLHSTTNRKMYALAHYRFRKRLEHTAARLGTRLYIVNESYTSKTCGVCGVLNQKLGSSKNFSCPCGVSCDRDANGARNIFIRTVTNHSRGD